MIFSRHKTRMPDRAQALPGRDRPAFEVPATHAVLGTSLAPPWPEGAETAVFGLGCFWGAERLFWTLPGVYTTAVGYAGRPTRRSAPGVPGTPRSCSWSSTRSESRIGTS
jgi:peptide-methionine (S)-S-oxide reductase